MHSRPSPVPPLFASARAIPQGALVALRCGSSYALENSCNRPTPLRCKCLGLLIVPMKALTGG